MNSSRQQILDRVRSAKKDLQAPSDHTAANRRLQEHPKNLIPRRGSIDKKARTKLFQIEAEKADATVVQLGATDQIPHEIARFLKINNLPTKLKSTRCLSRLNWDDTLLEVEVGIAHATDQVSITAAFAGVAETGTVVSHSGPDTPTTLNFLPITNIVVLDADKIYGNYEHVFKVLRDGERGDKTVMEYMPRTINFITGPSRSGDIEQTLLLGAHGPQRLHIIIVSDELP